MKEWKNISAIGCIYYKLKIIDKGIIKVLNKNFVYLNNEKNKLFILL